MPNSEEKTKVRPIAPAGPAHSITWVSIHFRDDDVFRVERFSTYAGRMLTLAWKTFSGSYLALSSRSRL
jgi:hypothetical protein